MHLDINLKRGVWVTGRIIDGETRKPVRGQVEYFVFVDNPHLQAYPGFRWTMIGPHFAGADGVFHFVAFPGPGVLAARAHGSEYIRAAGVEKIKKPVRESDSSLPIRTSRCPTTSTSSTRSTRPRARTR